MTKVLKIAGLILAGLVLYSFGATGTYRLHEARWPGSNEGYANGSEFIAVLWPICLPLTLGILVAEELIQ